MVRVAVIGTVLLVLALTIAPFALPQSASSSGTTTTTTTTTATTSPAGTTFLGAPGTVAPAGSTFLGAPIPGQPVVNTGAVVGTPITNNIAAAATAADLAAALPVTVYGPPPGYQTVVVPYPVATPVAPQTAAAQQIPAAPSASYPSATTGYSNTNASAVGTIGKVAALPAMSDDQLLAQAQTRLQSAARFGDRVTVDVRRGVILVTTHNLTPAERDRAFIIARSIHGAVGVIVASR